MVLICIHAENSCGVKRHWILRFAKYLQHLIWISSELDWFQQLEKNLQLCSFILHESFHSQCDSASCLYRLPYLQLFVRTRLFTPAQVQLVPFEARLPAIVLLSPLATISQTPLASHTLWVLSSAENSQFLQSTCRRKSLLEKVIWYRKRNITEYDSIIHLHCSALVTH